MPIDLAAAKTEMKRLSVLPFWAATSSAAFTELVDILRSNCDDLPHASRAISKALLGSSVPRPADLTDFINETRAAQVTSYPGGCCGRFSDKYRLPDGSPSQCENGWIRDTKWKEIKGMVDEEGRPMVQRYDFSGRCACQPGGTIRL